MSDDLVCFLINAINIRTDFEKCHDLFLEKETSVYKATRFFLFDSMDSHQFTAFMFFLLGSILTAAIGYLLWLASEDKKQTRRRSMSSILHRAISYNDSINLSLASKTFENCVSPRRSLEIFEIDEKDLIKSNSILGRGNFGEVFKWILRRDDILMEVAVKRCRIYTNEQRYLVAKELEIMCMLGRHPNIVGFMGAVTVNPRSSLLVLEYADCGNLLDFLRARRDIFKNQVISENDENGNFPKQRKTYSFIQHPAVISNDLGSLNTLDLVSYAFQIANGMKYLASIMCVHRDLALRNCLVTHNKTIRVADFGLAREQKNEYYRLYHPL
ncbi:hypothetical protein CAEBREN_10327 [Caenorhabditis brenneri]|uniref:Protein kinase domain-containing protein n=1 Tax=Caenorhabditis brenneri TaxID=135651 RepID=G0NN52_CAEBE|nr:hypothetical protein CAEBREN_10327 [Caenorhabditis brenneri]